ncbi:cytochrome P450 [Streptomyces chattanoogensis]|uniref:Cytochrome P450 n=1 Tax=Streptomyces chattanoogensis TaxID=66876 RepID=A0A0N0XQI7_9ACTN|nr:cytochrome P450 [Streptomyces chattanoogensis]KPC58978.1 cytochrome P450 [Streptomyces chattanoogensis]
MNTPDPSPAPPPGCPAHGLGAEGIRRLYGPEAEADPRGLYEKLRDEHGAVAPVLVHGDLRAWLVLGHRENLDVARTPSRFSRDSRRWRDLREGRVPADHPLTPIAAWQPVCNFADGAEHERLRGAVTESLERFDRRGIRRYVTRFAGQLIDRFAQNGRADLVQDFAEQLPMLVMTQLVGMPESYGPRIVEAARDMLKGTETAVQSNEYITQALRQLVERKREQPGRDFTSWLLESGAAGQGAALSDEEILEHVRLVLIAAFETTANLIANTLRLVLTDRRFRASLSGGHMTLPDALEQVLWDEPPLTTILGRWATGDTVLGGAEIREGDMMLLGLAAGNVDPEIRPDLASPVHGNRSHLAFSGGPHECPGQDIGRAIADSGIDTLLTRLPDLELAVPEGALMRSASLMSHQLVSLPVTFTPRGAGVTGSTPVQPRSSPLPAAVPAPTPSAPAEAAAPRSWWSRLFG